MNTPTAEEINANRDKWEQQEERIKQRGLLLAECRELTEAAIQEIEDYAKSYGVPSLLIEDLRDLLARLEENTTP